MNNGHALLDLVDLTLPTGFMLVAATRAWSAWQNRSFATAALAVAAFLLGTALVILLPSVYTTLGNITGVPNIARPLGHAAAIAGLGSGVLYVGYATKHLTTRYPPFLTIPTSLAMIGVVACFWFADTPVMHFHGPDFMSAYGAQPGIVAAWVITLTYELAVFVTLGLMTWRYAPHAGLPSTRVSLRVVSTACLFGVGYATTKATVIIHLSVYGTDPTWADHPLRHLLFWYVPNALIIIGLSIPAVAAARRRGPKHIAAWRAARTIRPLWEDLIQVAPDLALGSPNTKETIGSSVTILYRRVIEVVDVVNRIRAYLPDPVVYQAEAIAQGLAGLNVDAYVRACQIADALTTINTTPNPDHATPATSQQTKLSAWTARTNEVSWSTEPPTGDVDLALNQAFWVQVGRYYPDAKARQTVRARASTADQPN